LASTPSHDLRTILKWNTLQTRRIIHRLVLVHRCLTGLAPPYLQAHFMTNASFGYNSTKGHDKLQSKTNSLKIHCF